MDYRLHKQKVGITEDNQHAEISTTYPHQAATPKHKKMLKSGATTRPNGQRSPMRTIAYIKGGINRTTD